MPGVVGTMGPADSRRFEAALEKLAILPHSTTERHPVCDGVALASVCRRRRSNDDTSFATDSGVAVLIHGSMFRESPWPHRVDAAELLGAARESRLAESLADCDGGYTVVAVHGGRGTVTVLADRVGSQPVFFASDGDRFAFGPEVKAVLTALGKSARYSRAAVLQFLAVGYNLGPLTLFEGVSYLEPGTVLERDLRAGRTTIRRYWSLQHRPDETLRERSVAEEALFEAMVRSHRLLLADDPAQHEVLLSGGLDSRGMLGVLDHIGARPAQAVAWGLSKDIRWSDANIAERLATAHGVPFRFLQYTTAACVDNAAEWAYASELANDNVGWYGEGIGSLRDFYAAGTGVAFVGDEVLGSGGLLLDEAHARAAASLPYRVPPALDRVLRPAARGEAREGFEAAFVPLMAPCQSRNWSDRRDYLYLHGRGARYIMSLGYYKEHATELRRPFLARSVIDVMQRAPARFRMFKNLYCTTLTRFLPRVMRYPRNIASSLPDWSFDTRRDPRIAQLLRGLLDYAELERGPLAELVDRGSFEDMRERFLRAAVSPLSRDAARWKAAAIIALYRSASLTRALTVSRALKVATKAPEEVTNEFDVLRRVALLTLLQRRLAEMSAT